MSKMYVYHAVTEKPMELGQIIIFGEEHHNGVYKRVMACKHLLDGNEPFDPLTEFIHSNLEYWKVRTNRELAMEKVRLEKYPFYPSRMACLYTTKTLEEAKMWANSFKASGRKVYHIVKLRVDGHIFEGDAYNVFDGSEHADENEQNADYYWNNQPNKAGKERLVELLVSGNIEVVELINV